MLGVPFEKIPGAHTFTHNTHEGKGVGHHVAEKYLVGEPEKIGFVLENLWFAQDRMVIFL